MAPKDHNRNQATSALPSGLSYLSEEPSFQAIVTGWLLRTALKAWGLPMTTPIVASINKANDSRVLENI